MTKMIPCTSRNKRQSSSKLSSHIPHFIKTAMFTLAILVAGMGSVSAQTQHFVVPSGGTAGTTNGSGADPICRFYGSIRYQVVYTAAELNAAGMTGSSQITRLAWNVTESSVSLANYTVKMANTIATNSAAHNATATTTVKNPFTYGIALGYNDIIFDVPFTWDGTSNLLIEICSGTTNPFASPYGGVQAKTAITSGSRHYRVDGSSACGVNTNLANTTKPYVMLTKAATGPCSGTPNTPSISGATSACAGVNFNLSSAGASSGTGISYQWQSSTNGGASWSPISGATATSLTTNASTNTQYQLVTTCSASGLTSTSAAYSVTISSFSACTCFTYPAIYASSTFDEEISNVTVGSMNNSSSCSVAATGPGSILNRYANYAGVVTGPSAMQTSVVNFSLTQTTCGGNYGSFFQLYLDWNQDGDWLDLGEQVYSQGASVTGNQTVTGSFTVPAGATVGVTRMRVVHIEATASTTNYAHTSYFYGETEDYCFTVSQLVSCSGTPNAGVASISIANGCSGASATLSASGLSTGTGISYQWASGPSATGPWTNGSTSASTTVNPTANTYYQLTTTCASSGLSNTSNVVSFSVNTCAASITMTDQFGDGWNGASMNVLVNGSVFQTITLASGSSQTLNFCFPTNSTYALVYTAGGFYPTEVGVNMTVNGSLVYNVGYGGASVGATLVSGVSCPPPPTISSIPSSGCPGVPVSISGANLSGTTAVQFGGINAASFSVVNSSTILATPTANATGTITVITGTGSATSSSVFTILAQPSTPVITASQNQFCGTGGTVSLSASGGSGTYVWSALQGSPSLSSTSGSNITATLTQTSAIQLISTAGGCNSVATIQSFGVYSFPSITPSAVPSTICGGTSSSLSTGLSASNFTTICINPNPETIPSTATYLVNNGGAAVGLASGNLDDGGWSNVPLGFSFNFFGTNYSTINVGTNGVLQFGAYNGSFAGGLGDFTIGSLPNTVDPMGAIYGCANDLNCANPGNNVRYWTSGYAPNRKFIASYSVNQYFSSNPVNFQVILYETLGQVDIVATNIMSTNSKSIGVNSPNGTIGASAPNCSATPNTPNYWSAQTATIPATNPQAWKFIPPVNYVQNWSVNPTPNPATGQINGVTVSTPTTVQSPLSTTNYQVYIEDPLSGCSQTFQTPVIVIATPPAPTALNWSQCGPQVPQASVSCATCTGNQTFNWYTAPINGTLYQGVINENFNTSTTGTLFGNAALSGARCVLTENVASQNGALLLGSTGVNSNAYNVTFDFQVAPSDALGYNGADGFSYSFGDDVSATATTPAAENGSGTKLKLGFVSYTNGGSVAGIYLMYNCTVDEQTPTTTGVIAYSNDISWKNTSSPVAFNMNINNLGQVTLTLNGINIFNNITLPSIYLNENKANWLQLFKARTGAGFSRHAIDNVHVEALPGQQFTSVQQTVSNTVTYYVQTLDGLCGSIALTPVTITVNQAPTLAITPGFTACQNSSTPIAVTTGTSSFNNFSWSPSALLYSNAALTVPYVAGSSASTVYFSSSTSGVQPTITCTATDNGVGPLQCGALATTNITVLTNPTAPTITTSLNNVCLGGTSNLSVQLGATGISYCVPTYTTGTIFDDYIGRVQLGTINNVTLGSPAPFYTLYPSTGSTTTSLAAGSTQTISLSSGTYPFNQNMAVWIDYNQNGVFSDPGEKLGEVLNVPQFPATSTITFTVPGTALGGATRMRVRDAYFTTNLDPCLSYSYGETEDYVVNITGTATYSYTWSPAVAGNSSAPTVSTLPISGSTTFTAVVNDGTCSSAPSNAITIGIAGTPIITTAASSPVSGYCASAAQYTFDEEIFNVSLGSMNNSSTCTTLAGGPGSALETYSNFTSGAGAPAIPNLAAGSTTAGSVTVGSCGSFNYTSGLAVFIDFNQDGDFTDVGEKVFTNGPLANVNCVPATAVPISVTVPATAVGGQTRMRVVNQESISGDNITPCTIQSWGETEDYLVNITGGAVNIPCPGSTFNLSSTATNGGAPYAYAWTVLSGSVTLSAANISNPTAVVNTDAILQLTVSDACGAVVTSTVSANIDENPIAIVPANSVICINDIATLTASNGSNYTWAPSNNLSTTNGAVVSATPSATETYTVTASYGIGCTGTANTTITVNALPIVNAGPDQTLCAQNAATVSGSGASTYAWDNNISNGVAFTPTATATYTVVGTDANGCTNTDQVQVVVNALPNVIAGINQTLCAGTSVTLSGSGAVSYSWDNSINDGVAFTPTATNNYTVVGTDANGCTNTDQVQVVVNALPIVIAGINQTVCVGTAVTLSGTGAVTYSWDNSINDGVAFTPSNTATYTVTGTDANGCIDTDQLQVVVNALPIVIAGNSQTVCIGTVVTLSGAGAVTYSWDNSINDGVAFTPSNTATYTVTGTDINGCIDTDQVQVIVNPLPVTSAGNNQTVCSGTTVTLAGSGATSYSWNNNISNGVPFTATSTTTYTVTGTNGNGCVNTAQMTVIVNTLPVVTAGSNQSVCPGTAVTLNGSGALFYSWNNGISNGLQFTPSATTTYTVTGTASNGCSNTAQVQVTLNALPTVSAGSNQTICPGASVTLSGSGAASYSWNNSVSNGVAFTPSATTTYTVTGTNANGCSNTAQTTVTINPILTVNAGPDVMSCTGETVILSGQGANTYTWSNGVQNGQGFVPTATGVYSVSGVDGFGCTGTDQVTVYVNSASSSTVTALACNSYVLNGQTYNQSGTYSQTIPNAFGCDSLITLNLTLDTPLSTPIVTVSGGELFTNGQANTSYQWIFCNSGFPISDETDTLYVPNLNGQFAVTASNSCGSSTSACVTINYMGVEEAKGPSLNLYPNPTFDYVYFSGDINEGTDYELTDAQGRIILVGKLLSDKNINLFGMTTGLYWIKFKGYQPLQVVKQ